MEKESLRFVYFAGEPIGTPVLKELMECGYTPSLIVCNPDRPAGRGQQLTPPPVKVFAEENNIAVWQPESLKDQNEIIERLKDYDLFVVVAYNRILPSWLIELPKYKTINVHPSMLPLRRGPNPIRSAITEDDRASIGVSIMLLDEEIDHGPILDQIAMPIADEHWPIDGRQLEESLSNLGGSLLAATIESWVNGEITPKDQDHTKATYTTKLTKQVGELDIDPSALPQGEEARIILNRIRGLAGWPGTFFMHEGKRVKINEATITNDTLELISVTPEGKKPMSFDQWLPSSNR